MHQFCFLLVRTVYIFGLLYCIYKSCFCSAISAFGNIWERIALCDNESAPAILQCWTYFLYSPYSVHHTVVAQ